MDEKLQSQRENCELKNENSYSNMEEDIKEKDLDVKMNNISFTDMQCVKDESGETSGNDKGDEKYCHPARKLSEAEITKLQKDVTCVSDFKRNKLEKEAQKNWDLFYKRNTTKFFKDRHWTKREFDELCPMDVQVWHMVTFDGSRVLFQFYILEYNGELQRPSQYGLCAF